MIVAWKIKNMNTAKPNGLIHACMDDAIETFCKKKNR